MDLPASFVQSMRDLLGNDFDDFQRSYDDPPVYSLRINTSKINTAEFEKIAPFEARKIPFVSNGYYINGTDAWSKHPYYYAGLYYIQEASAMFPGEVLPVDEDDAVLDLCAAPGGKSTQLAGKHPKVLVSNDISHSRTIPLVKNLEVSGCGDYAVTCETPRKLSTYFAGCFDKILVDAPCSGEGMFRKDRDVAAAYLQKGPGSYRDIQRQILENAYEMLNCEGKLLYSTCTFSDIEDEQVILEFLQDHTDLHAVDINKEKGLSGPYYKYAGNTELKGVVHLFPHKIRGEGHFTALIQKNGIRQDIKPSSPATQTVKMPGCMKEFAGMFSDEKKQLLERSRYIISSDNRIYLIPDAVAPFCIKGIRYTRTGVYVGQMNRSGAFLPCTALALRLKADDFSNVYRLDAKDANVIKYLKGETLPAPDHCNTLEKGFVLICVDSYPLGFARSDGTRLKNLYEKGWVYR